VGATTTRRSDFRIIAATNRDLAKEVEKGTFRRDLFFRLNVVNIRLVPLRERREDIPALLNHFLARVGGNYSLTAEAMEVMLSYDWPGNVRELENCVQHMVAINSGPLLHVGDLPSGLQNHILQKKSQYLRTAAAAQPAPGGNSSSSDGSAFGTEPRVAAGDSIDDSQTGAEGSRLLPMGSASNPGAGDPGTGIAPMGSLGVIPLAELERRAIMNALEYTKGDRAVAAHLLGIGRTTLYRKLKEYQLQI
jgi:two-component system response regulator HydG